MAYARFIFFSTLTHWVVHLWMAELLLNSKTGNRADDDALQTTKMPQGAANFLKATCEIVSFEIRQMTFFL